jgi:hypothetical protein
MTEPSPAGVVDYTERAREVIGRSCGEVVDYIHGSELLLHWQVNERLIVNIAAALSAVASERDAAPLHLDTLEADEFSEISDVERGERGDEYVAVTRAAISDALSDQRAGIGPPRLRPASWIAAIMAASGSRNLASRAASVARVIITKIGEMLK